MPPASDPECHRSRAYNMNLPDHCRHHEHFGVDVLDEEFQISVDRMFQVLFTDSSVFSELHRRRRTYDVVLTPWPEEPDPDGNKVRSISYTLSINYSIGPKCSPSTERQIIYPETKPGVCYLIDAECFNQGVPYADNFYSVVRYCVTRSTPSRCRLIITGKVCYRKPMWGLLKNFIDKTATTGITSSFSLMAELLRTYARQNQNEEPRVDSPASFQALEDPAPSPEEPHDTRPRRRVRRKRRTTATTHDDPKPPRTALTAVNDTNSRPIKGATTTQSTQSDQFATTDFLAVLIFIAILALVVVNAVLFYQIKRLEAAVARIATPPHSF